ncbi:MAG: RidA family protein [Alphaproteobacteria bacterium]|nr:RidA family protein [Alphaproteobacteria bacterium]MDD9919737.1 RidA family protein [Alphaproteobacteria bacterium]
MIERNGTDVPILSESTVHNGVAYLSGWVSWDNQGGSITAQSEEIFAKIDQMLAEAGSDKEHLLFANIWLTSVDYIQEFNNAWLKWLENSPKPARACVEAKLLRPGWDVEVAVTAAVKEEKGK